VTATTPEEDLQPDLPEPAVGVIETVWRQTPAALCGARFSRVPGGIAVQLVAPDLCLFGTVSRDEPERLHKALDIWLAQTEEEQS
jgi:hypothetical protein